jgi:hypothetical protein
VGTVECFTHVSYRIKPRWRRNNERDVAAALHTSGKRRIARTSPPQRDFALKFRGGVAQDRSHPPTAAFVPGHLDFPSRPTQGVNIPRVSLLRAKAPMGAAAGASPFTFRLLYQTRVFAASNKAPTNQRLMTGECNTIHNAALAVLGGGGSRHREQLFAGPLLLRRRRTLPTLAAHPLRCSQPGELAGKHGRPRVSRPQHGDAARVAGPAQHGFWVAL